MKNTVSLLGVVTLFFVLLLGCSWLSGPPSGMMPSNVGKFTRDALREQSTPSGKIYNAIYKSPEGIEVLVDITVYQNTDRAKEQFEISKRSYNDQNDPAIKSSKEGNKYVTTVNRAGEKFTYIVWLSNNWHCSVRSESDAAARQFVENLSYK